RAEHDTRPPHTGRPDRGALAQRRRRDGRDDTCTRLVADAYWPDRLLVPEPPHDGAFSARQPFSVASVVGPPVRLDLQRCLSPSTRDQAPVGAGAPSQPVLAGELAC